MNYQGTAYSYNQRGEIIIPTRKGTTYYGAHNHKPLVIYTNLDTDLEFFITNTDRKPINIDGKTFSASVIDRNSKSIVLTKTLIPNNYDLGNVIMRISQGDSSTLTPGLYDLIITYTDEQSRTYGLHSDQNNRISYVLEVKGNPFPTETASNSADSFLNNGSGNYYSSIFPSTAQTFNEDGTNTAAFYVTNFTGTVFAQGSLDNSPADNTWFNIQLDPENSEDSWTFVNETGVIPFTWDGMFMWVRFYYVPDPSNTGTLDKILYRA
jgi:hypothetical protein